MDDAAIQAMFTDWNSDVGVYISDLTERVHAAAVATAPVSPRGSKYAPPGFLRTRVAQTHKQADDTGYVLGLVGVPLRAGSRYPLPFVDNEQGVTRNANARGHYGFRPAVNRFLQRALAAVMGGA